MAIKESEFNSIVAYVKSKLEPQIVNKSEINGRVIDVLPGYCIRDLQEEVPYSDYLVQSVNQKKVVKKKLVVDKYKVEWDAFWALWPSTKSVPDTKFESGAKMKGSEANMYQKWLHVIEYDLNYCDYQVAIKTLYRAADCYLEWAYSDSKRLGRNELQYRNGMEPWFNQELYKIFATKEYPPVQKEEVPTDYSINI